MSDLVLDLSKASFIDHDCLLLLAGLVADRREQGWRTQLELPDNDSVLDFLRAWKFPDFLGEVSPESPIFTPKSLDLLASRDFAVRPRYVSVITGPDGTPQPVTLLRSLAITPIRLSKDPWSDAAVASQRFLLRNFQAVVERTLGRAAGSQLADVVREAVLNASAHPLATLAATSSHFRPRLQVTPDDQLHGEAPTELQFSIWDNGAPISATLGGALDRSQPITSSHFGREGAVFRVRLEEVAGGYGRVELTDQNERGFASPQGRSAALLTCAAFMLGVTSDPANAARRNRQDTASARTAGGVGLAIIRRAALDSNYGRLEYRSGNLRLTATRAHDAPVSTYDFHVSAVPEQMWHIQGNLLQVTLPLKLTP